MRRTGQRLRDGRQEILRLHGEWRETFQSDSSFDRFDPKRAIRLIWLQWQIRKVAITKLVMVTGQRFMTFLRKLLGRELLHGFYIALARNNWLERTDTKTYGGFSFLRTYAACRPVALHRSPRRTHHHCHHRLHGQSASSAWTIAALSLRFSSMISTLVLYGKERRYVDNVITKPYFQKPSF